MNYWELVPEHILSPISSALSSAEKSQYQRKHGRRKWHALKSSRRPLHIIKCPLWTLHKHWAYTPGSVPSKNQMSLKSALQTASNLHSRGAGLCSDRNSGRKASCVWCHRPDTSCMTDRAEMDTPNNLDFFLATYRCQLIPIGITAQRKP